MPEKPLLEISGLKKYYPIEAGITKRQVGLVKAVDDITLSIRKNEFWVWWESPAVARQHLEELFYGLLEPTAGTIKFNFESGD